LASAIYDASWLSISPISTAGGHTDRLVNAHPERRRSLPGVKSVAKSLRRQCSVGSITSTISLHDHPDGDFAPYRPLRSTTSPYPRVERSGCAASITPPSS
jgi:hypothetical protein